jgi:tetratricopeptide (TPR) repeat protein
MGNQALWTIDNELDGRHFERLCVDLLYRNGFRDIVPIEPQDGGRDAEEFPRQGRDQEGCAAFFQFSLEQNWKVKLRRDARKLSDRRSEFSTLVFVTSRTARGVDVDALKKEFRQEYGWTLIVFSREWLRLQLEEAHPDLAKKHLDVDVLTLSQPSGVIQFASDSMDEQLSSASARMAAGAYEPAIVELKAYLENHPESYSAWQALAWSHYCLNHLEEALADINRASKLKDTAQSRSIRACILVEKGISQKNKSSVIEGLRLLEELLTSLKVHTWHIFYNLGNALGALGKHEEAIARYKQAIALDARRPELWKNLASSYHLSGDHQAEMECFDKALELDPLRPEALVSKGVSLMMDFGRPEEAVPLLETALRYGSALAVRWPHIWYWLGMAYQRSGDPRKALTSVENGLAHRPGDRALKKLKSDIFDTLVVQSPESAEEARQFWKTELTDKPFNYGLRSRLVGLEAKQGDHSAAWALLDECFRLIELSSVTSLSTSNFSISECTTALRFLPQYAVYRASHPISDYWNPGDPLYDLPFAPPLPGQSQNALATLLAIPFGLGVQHLEEHRDTDSRDNLTVFFDTLRNGIEHAISEGGRAFAAVIPERDFGNDDIAARTTELMMFLGLISLREFGRQRGWIAAQFRISSSSLERAMDSYNESQIEVNVMSKTFISLKEALKNSPA